MTRLLTFSKPAAALLAVKAAMILPFLMLVACSSSGGYDVDDITPPGEFAGVQIIGGNNQTAVAGTELPDPLVARLIDIQGNAIPNQAVRFVVGSGGGSLSSGTVISDGSGLVQTRWTLGSGAGSQKVEIRGEPGPDATSIFAEYQALATAGMAALATPVAGTNGQAAQHSTGLPEPVSVSVVDLQGNAKPGVTVTFKPCATCGTVAAASAVTNAGGIASSAWTLGAAAGPQTLSASIAGLPEVHFQATATSAAIGAPTHLARLQGDAQAVDPHGRNAQALRVFVTDALGRGVPGVAVDFAPAADSAFFVAQTISTGTDGVAEFSAYFHEAGAVRVEAGATGLAPVYFDLAVASGAFEFDGRYDCRFADLPAAPFELAVTENSISGGGLVSADGTFAVTRADYGRSLRGAISIGMDGSAVASGTSNEAASRGEWTCERR